MYGNHKNMYQKTLVLFVLFLFSLIVPNLMADTQPTDDKEANDFICAVALVYGIHSQLVITDHHIIPALDALVTKTKNYLDKLDIGFHALTKNPQFLLTCGKATWCAYSYAAEIDHLFNVHIEPRPPSPLMPCEKLPSLAKAINTIKTRIDQP